MEKLLRLYTYVDGGINDTPFPNADNPIEIGAFRYDAKRMGGAPTITASVNYASCLDDEWTDNVYAMFNGEKFYLKQIPTSSYNNTSAMYKHDIELVSERVALDNVYFFDVVSEDVVDDDKPVSNSTKVVFFGDVREFANRLKASLQYSALDYDVVVDTGVASEEKLISFEDQFFSNVLQEIYNTYEVPYYFEGKTIHIGYSKPNEELPSFAYGVDDALLSISKNNANYKVVNRATGTGSSENIPFYYPNNSPKGNIRAELNTASDDFSIEAVDLPTFSNKIDLDGVIEAKMVSLSVSGFMLNDEEYTLNYMPQAHITVNSYQIYRDNVAFVAYSSSAVKGKFAFTIRMSHDASEYMAKIHVGDKTLDPISVVDDKINFEIEVDFEKAGNKEILAEVALSYIPQGHSSIRRAYNVAAGSGLGWFYKDKAIELKDVGIKYQGTPSEGDKITQKLIEYINTSQSLMPSKYRDTKGAERFYNATNNTYEGVTFNNPFVAGKPPKEHIVKIEDIKPSIEGMLVNGQRIDMFSEFAYDEDDNDETYEDEEGKVYFKHPYFYGKLRVMDFNLFDHAIENQPMTISFTSGDVGACNFEIGVTEEYPQKNPVQVYEEDITIDGILHKAGSLKRDENGMVLAGVEGTQQLVTEFQDRQQDTSKYEVWVALNKEEETYGILMPQVAHRPKACAEGQNDGDTFVILGINLPDEYILNAERRLEAEIIKYLQDNNDEKFTFSIGFSRIYFAENEDVLNSLNENSKIQITYDNKTYDLYVSSFSYTMSESDALPEIKVELDETLKTSQNAIQKAINEVKTTLGSAINEVSQGVAMQRRSYVSKVQDDTAMGVVDFSKGVKFGEGGKVEILDNNSAKLTIEYLEVTKKATFTSLEIQEKTHVGGQMLVTPASMNCGEVEEFEGFYRCYFQTKGADGSEEIFNQFAVGDQAICQTFNAWGSKYYWRLVVGVGEDYVDLSKEDCDEGSGVPEAGDRIIQMGNRDNADRQNAIVIAAHGDNSPYIVQYKGINNFDLPKTEDDERITTLLSPTKNILTGQVKMQAGSKGLEMFEEWAEVEAALGNIEGLETIKEVIENNFTAITGGLIQSGLLMLGYYDEEDRYHVMSGTNGVYDASALGGGIAAWYGGAMSEDSAKTVLRFDGSGFFANKNITWDNEGGASFAGGKITITKEGALTFADTISFGSGGDSVATVLEKLSTLLSYFTLKGNELSTNYQVRIKNNLIVEQDTSSGGEGQDTPGAGLDEDEVLDIVKGYTYSKSEINKLIDDVNAGDVDLTNYYTKDEVDAKIPSLDGYATEDYVDDAITALNLSQYAKGSDLDALAKRVTAEEEVTTTYASWWADLKKHIKVEGGNVKIDTNLIISGDTSSGGSGQDTPASGTVTGIKVNGRTYEPIAGIVTIPDYPTSLTWSAISGKPSFATVATSGKYSDLSGLPTIPTVPTKVSAFTNDSGYITGITKSMVDSALGYTPLSTGGGTISGRLDVDSTSKSDNPLSIRSNATDANGACRISFYDSSNAFQGYVMTGWGNLILAHRSWNQIGVGDSGIWCSTDNGITKNTLIHSGNIGSYAFVPKSEIVNNTDADYLLTNGVYLNATGNGSGNSNFPQSYSIFATFAQSEKYLAQLSISYNSFYFRRKIDTWDEWREVIHSGNIGSYALKTDGSNEMAGDNGLRWADNMDFETLRMGLRTFMSSNGTSVEGVFPSTNYGTVLHVGINVQNYAFQLGSSVNADGLFYRGYYASGQKWNDWKTIAFTDSNVASAQALTHSNGTVGAVVENNGNIVFKHGSTVYQSGDANVAYYGTAQSGLGSSYDGALMYAYHGKPLYFYTGGIRMLINSSGNVTIGGSDLAGTTYKMSVDGKVHIRSTAGASMNEGAGSLIVGNGTVLMIDANDIQAKTNGTTAGPLYINDWGGNVILCGQNNGNVGIGTNAPKARLDVNGSLYAVEYSSLLNNKRWIFGAGVITGNENHFAFSDSTSYRAHMIIDSVNSYVGIGTTSPAYQLDVNGDISAMYSLRIGGCGTIYCGLYPNSQITSGGNATRLWLYNEQALAIYGSTIEMISAVTMSSTLSVATSVTTPLLKSSDGLDIVANGSAAGSRLFLTSNCFRPWGDDTKLIDLGASNVQWRNVYAVGATFSGNVNINGNLVVSGDTSSGSDIRFKDIIKNKTIKIEHIAKAPLFTFKWNDREDDTIHLGSSAQYWEKVTPWLVKGEDFKTLDYSTLGVAMGISLAKKAVNHEERIKVLEKENKALKEEIRRMQYGS